MEIREVAAVRRWAGWAGFAVLALTIVLWSVARRGESADLGIKVNSSTSSNITIGITNGASTNFYEVYAHSFLGSNAPVAEAQSGEIGVTNFTFFRGAESRATSGSSAQRPPLRPVIVRPTSKVSANTG